MSQKPSVLLLAFLLIEWQFLSDNRLWKAGFCLINKNISRYGGISIKLCYHFRNYFKHRFDESEWEKLEKSDFGWLLSNETHIDQRIKQTIRLIMFYISFRILKMYSVGFPWNVSEFLYSFKTAQQLFKSLYLDFLSSLLGCTGDSIVCVWI